MFNEVVCERGLAKGEAPTPCSPDPKTHALPTTHMASRVRVKFRKAPAKLRSPSSNLVTCRRKLFFSFSQFPDAKIQAVFPCSGLGKPGRHTLPPAPHQPPVREPRCILLISWLSPRVRSGVGLSPAP